MPSMLHSDRKNALGCGRAQRSGAADGDAGRLGKLCNPFSCPAVAPVAPAAACARQLQLANRNCHTLLKLMHQCGGGSDAAESCLRMFSNASATKRQKHNGGIHQLRQAVRS